MCNKCNSRGGYTISQQHPWGSTYATEYLWEDCPACVGEGKCPDCDGPISDEGTGDWKCLNPECGLTMVEAQKRDAYEAD